MQPFTHIKKWLVLALVALTLTVSGLPSSSQTPPIRNVPTFSSDWSAITFRTLSTLPTAGGFTAPPELVQALGFDPSRVWDAGQAIGEVLELGDFAETYQLQQFTLEQISAVIGLDLSALSLADLALLTEQTLSDILDAIPPLGNLPVSAVAPIVDLLEAHGLTFSPNIEIASLLGIPDVAGLVLDSINLEQYGLDSLPSLIASPIDAFSGWEQIPLTAIPGLIDVPFAAFPSPLGLLQGIPVRVDVVFGNAEGGLTRTVSGSRQAGFQVPCLQNCAHIELGEPALGGQWVSGLTQQVQGGYGFLGQVNGGQEPTGRHPYGSGFKVVVLETDEATGTAATGLYFRMCSKTAFVDLGCTPYFIGPVPWLPLKEEGWTVM